MSEDNIQEAAAEQAEEPQAPPFEAPEGLPTQSGFTEKIANEQKSWENKMMKMQRLLAAQKKESVRIPKAIGPQSVVINGARFNIPAGIPVDVPKDVADLLRLAEII